MHAPAIKDRKWQDTWLSGFKCNERQSSTII
jgi:hypothetical protein